MQRRPGQVQLGQVGEPCDEDVGLQFVELVSSNSERRGQYPQIARTRGAEGEVKRLSGFLVRPPRPWAYQKLPVDELVAAPVIRHRLQVCDREGTGSGMAHG
jgi:hypothetical protein